MAMAYELNEKQMAGLRERFAGVLDVDREIAAAREYAEHFHRGRPYKNFGMFVWNWLRRDAERVERRRRVVATGQPRPRPAAVGDGLTEAQLRAIAEDPDESKEMRDLAAETLREMAQRAQDRSAQ